ncbi:zinc finger protein 62 isoform X2 [Poecilia reticulata]|uniref:zinc finger protein 62 isoform X2 n=1 Tax=Poecilia reticulata TaxID=8081 RepID=UPI0004A4DD77|nr:PREDICTED: zinc finger protein 62-like isoform X2 [Poecilia reticulata]
MKPQLSGAQRRAFAPSLCGSEAVRSIQEELVAAIHGALEVAVEIAVREVRTLVGQATSDMYVELRRENESLKEKLQRAEEMLAECERLEDNDRGVMRRGEAPHPTPCGLNTNATTESAEIRSELAGHGRPGPDVRDPTEMTSRMIALKNEGVITCRNPRAPESAQPLSTAIKSTMQEVIVKQERLEEQRSGASCCLQLIKEENLSMEGIGWPPEETDIQSQDPETRLLGARVDQACPPDVSSSLPSASDLQSVSPEFPNIFHLAEQASVSQVPPQVHRFHLEAGRSVAGVPTCKFCGQTFPLPSLLRRHYGQCRQRLQQRCLPPVAGGPRTRLQLYPPGCSPFRCTVCSREFNRLENLKTHLRIHTGERPYTCSVCLKCFRHSGALTRHFRIHTGEKPYVCGQCGKSFRNCGGLKFHQRSHSDNQQ